MQLLSKQIRFQLPRVNVFSERPTLFGRLKCLPKNYYRYSKISWIVTAVSVLRIIDAIISRTRCLRCFLHNLFSVYDDRSTEMAARATIPCRYATFVNIPPGHGILKVDFCNAFNAVYPIS